MLKKSISCFVIAIFTLFSLSSIASSPYIDFKKFGHWASYLYDHTDKSGDINVMMKTFNEENDSLTVITSRKSVSQKEGFSLISFILIPEDGYDDFSIGQYKTTMNVQVGGDYSKSYNCLIDVDDNSIQLWFNVDFSLLNIMSKSKSSDLTIKDTKSGKVFTFTLNGYVEAFQHFNRLRND